VTLLGQNMVVNTVLVNEYVIVLVLYMNAPGICLEFENNNVPNSMGKILEFMAFLQSALDGSQNFLELLKMNG